MGQIGVPQEIQDQIRLQLHGQVVAGIIQYGRQMGIQRHHVQIKPVSPVLADSPDLVLPAFPLLKYQDLLTPRAFQGPSPPCPFAPASGGFVVFDKTSLRACQGDSRFRLAGRPRNGPPGLPK